MQLLEKPMHGCSMGVPGLKDYCNSRGEVGEGEVGVAATSSASMGRVGHGVGLLFVLLARSPEIPSAPMQTRLPH